MPVPAPQSSSRMLPLNYISVAPGLHMGPRYMLYISVNGHFASIITKLTGQDLAL